MKQILLVQSRKTPQKAESEIARFQRAVGTNAHISFKSSVDTTLDWENPRDIVAGFDAVFFGGSSDFFFDGGREETDPERAGTFEVLERMRPLIQYLLDEKIPTLAVCLGHQIVAEMYGGKVSHDKRQRKMGTYPVFLNAAGKADKLFSKLPDFLNAQYAHRDSVTSLPQGATLLAEGPACLFSALRYGKAMYTTQFHPELISADLLSNKESIKEYLDEGKTIEEVVQESPESTALIPAFLKVIAKPKSPGFRPQMKKIASLDS